MSRCIIGCCLILTIITSSWAFAAKVRLQVTGLSGELEKNVRVSLSTIGEDEVNADRRFQARVDKAIRQGLRALGYYAPSIEFNYEEKPPPNRPILHAKVTPGEPVKIRQLRVLLTGEAEKDKDYQQLIANNPVHVGDILNHGAYERFKSGLTSLAWHKGFFDAEMKKSQLGVAQERHEAFWDIEFDSGQRYRFGKVHFSGAQIRDDYLQNLIPFKERELYDSELLAELNRRLSASGWFNSAIVTPDLKEVGQDKVLPLEGVVTPRKRNIVESGVGYSTDNGPRTRLSWIKPWVNSRGHSLNTTLSVSAPEQVIDFSYKMPVKANPLEQYYLVQGGFKREDLNDTKADSTTLNLARYWDLSKAWQYAVNMRWSYDQFTQAAEKSNAMLLYPGANINRTRQQGGLMPSWGDTQLYSIDVSNKAWGSDVDFLVLQAQNTWIRSLAEKHRFIARGTVGWIDSNNFSRIPPSLRFFAGGDRSIRGYKYKSISPEDSKGKLTGASRLATGSLEYQYNVTGQWWGAVFVDSGEAVASWQSTDIKTGAGFGIRWVSPVGPVKLDIATPIGDKDHHNVQLYIGLGPEL